MNNKQKRFAFASEVRREMSTGASYDEAFRTISTLRPDLTASEPADLPYSSERTTVANVETDDPVAGASRRDRITAAIQEYCTRLGLDPKKHYDRAWNAVFRANPALFSSVAPRRSPQTQWETTRSQGLTPESKYWPYNKNRQPEVSTLRSNPRTKELLP